MAMSMFDPYSHGRLVGADYGYAPPKFGRRELERVFDQNARTLYEFRFDPKARVYECQTSGGHYRYDEYYIEEQLQMMKMGYATTYSSLQVEPEQASGYLTMAKLQATMQALTPQTMAQEMHSAGHKDFIDESMVTESKKIMSPKEKRDKQEKNIKKLVAYRKRKNANKKDGN